MKRLILVVSLLLFCCTFAGASPYFRVMSHDATGFHPQINAGAFLDPFAIGTESGGGMMVPIVTHSPKDGCFFPGLTCEDWSPFGAGWSVSHGQATLAIGPAVNLTPIMRGGLLYTVNALASGDKLANLKGMLSPPAPGVPDVTISVAPLWAYDVLHNHGYFRVFTGAALKF